MATVLGGIGKNVEKALCRSCREEWPLNEVSGLGRVLILYGIEWLDLSANLAVYGQN